MRFPFAITGIITGLTIGTTYWFDLTERAVSGGGTSAPIGNHISIAEF
jgi:hypothetical protein